jgi:Thrombospondin type 3 repeat
MRGWIATRKRLDSYLGERTKIAAIRPPMGQPSIRTGNPARISFMRIATTIMLWIASALTLTTTVATAVVEVDANVAGVFTNINFTTPTSAVIVDGDSFGGLSVNNGVVIHVDVTNLASHDVRAIFLTLNFDPTKLSYMSGSLEPLILAQTTPFGVVFLHAVDSSPEFKINDLTNSTLTGASYGNPLGTTGQGPDPGAVEFAFRVLDAAADINVGLEVGYGNGLLIDGTVVDQFNIGSNPNLVQLDSATLYVPEPSQVALLVAGLAGLIVAASWRRRRRARRPVYPHTWALLGVFLVVLTASFSHAQQILDTDNDGVPDVIDNCPFVPNGPNEPNPQADTDGDFVGDVCDNCPGAFNLKTDADLDDVDDVCDNCLLAPNGPQQVGSQVDTDQDGFGNVCDADYDQDGYVLGLDVIFWLQNCSGSHGIPQCDLRANGTGGDNITYLYLTDLFNLEIGPSALSCATIPPVNVTDGDPPCVP